MAPRPIVSRGDVFDPASNPRELIRFAKAGSRFVSGIVNRYAVAAETFHHSETRNIRRTITEIDHIRKRDRSQMIGHVVIHIVRRIEHPFVDPK